MTPSRILVVDDDPTLLESCRMLLEQEQFVVGTAASGKEALQCLTGEEAGWDLVLLDLKLPDVDGIALMEDIRAQGIDCSIVVLSGKTGFQSVSRAFQNGAYDFLRKPYDPLHLINTVTNALKKRQLEHDFRQLRNQLERSERLHRFMIESSPDIILIIDSAGRFRFVNDRAGELLGYRKEELQGQHYSMIVDPDCMTQAASFFGERRRAQRTVREEKLWLLGNPVGQPDHTARRIAIELNAMGVYENEDGSGNQSAKQQYAGTYVVARDITARLDSESLIRFQAYHDQLTGLANRTLFMDRLSTAVSSARRHKRHLAVLFLDLDRFKAVNDTLGHAVGDDLLRQVAQRLKDCLRESDTLARLGGDEFVLLLPDIESREGASLVAEKIVRSIREPIHLARHELCITTSIGIALYPEDGTSAEALIRHADIAMYHAKDHGKDSFSIYTKEMSDQQKAHLSIETEIRYGLSEQQFAVYYQPQIRARDGVIVGIEALLRWQHPERGLLTPSSFMPVAEETGLIVELGEWGMRQALKDVQEWRSAGLDVPRLAVNVSYRQIQQADFADRIIRLLKSVDCPGDRFELEITENALMADWERTLDKLHQLRNFGIRIAIGSFGSGYSSLSRLQKMPIDRLKIDRSFIQALQSELDRAVVEAILHLARGLKLEAVAEGVEQDFQLRYLSQLDCPVVQGHIFSQCVPGDEMRRMLEHNAAAPGLRGGIGLIARVQAEAQ